MATSFSLPRCLAATAALLILYSAALTPTSAETVPQPTQDTPADQFFQAHNQARKSVGASPLTWSLGLAEQAEKMIIKHQQAGRDTACQHFDNKVASKQWVNQAVSNIMETPERAVEKWVDGRRYYNNHNKSCAAEHEDACGAYKLVVSMKMWKLGCASTHCGRDGTLTVCLYSPRENIHDMSPPALLQSSQTKEFLDAHNQARASVGASPLTWSLKLAERASKMAAKQQQAGHGTASCPLYDSAKLRKYWANQAVGNFMEKPATVVDKWMDGRRYYNHVIKSCAATEYKDACDAYERVVSEKTTELGCAAAHCGKDGSLTICLYSPRGKLHSKVIYEKINYNHRADIKAIKVIHQK